MMFQLVRYRKVKRRIQNGQKIIMFVQKERRMSGMWEYNAYTKRIKVNSKMYPPNADQVEM